MLITFAVTMHAPAVSVRRGAFTLFTAVKMQAEPPPLIVFPCHGMGLIAPEEQAKWTLVVPTTDAFAAAINK
jgi:hypothetical protein